MLQLAIGSEVPASAEGYLLELKEGQATITSRSQAGPFYGCQTLQQLLEDARDQQIPIPACRISDYPELDYRAVHLDLKHHLDASNNYYQLIDRLAQVKVNAIIVEFEDKLRYRKAPEIGAGHALSVEELPPSAVTPASAISRSAPWCRVWAMPLLSSSTKNTKSCAITLLPAGHSTH